MLKLSLQKVNRNVMSNLLTDTPILFTKTNLFFLTAHDK